MINLPHRFPSPLAGLAPPAVSQSVGGCVRRPGVLSRQGGSAGAERHVQRQGGGAREGLGGAPPRLLPARHHGRDFQGHRQRCRSQGPGCGGSRVCGCGVRGGDRVSRDGLIDWLVALGDSCPLDHVALLPVPRERRYLTCRVFFKLVDHSCVLVFEENCPLTLCFYGTHTLPRHDPFLRTICFVNAAAAVPPTTAAGIRELTVDRLHRELRFLARVVMVPT